MADRACSRLHNPGSKEGTAGAQQREMSMVSFSFSFQAHSGDAMATGPEVAGHSASTVRGQREMDAAAQLTFPFTRSGAPVHGCPPHSGWIFPQLNCSENTLTDKHKGVSQMIPNPVRLTMDMKHATLEAMCFSGNWFFVFCFFQVKYFKQGSLSSFVLATHLQGSRLSQDRPSFLCISVMRTLT